MLANRLYGPGGQTSGAQTPGAIPLNTAGAGSSAAFPPTSTILQTILTTAETVFLNPLLSATALILSLPAGPTDLEQLKFLVRGSGYLNLGTSSTVTVKLYYGTSTTVGNDTLLGSSGAITAFSGKCPWYVEAPLIYDNQSGKLQGSIKFMVNNTLVAEVAISNVITGLLSTNNPIANFVLSFTFGTAGTQIVGVRDFAIDG